MTRAKGKQITFVKKMCRRGTVNGTVTAVYGVGVAMGWGRGYHFVIEG